LKCFKENEFLQSELNLEAKAHKAGGTHKGDWAIKSFP